MSAKLASTHQMSGRSGGEVGCELVGWNKSHELRESGSYPGAQLSGLVSGTHGDLPFVKG